MKVCSLIPSGTEILFALGLGDQVAAVTSYCDYPPEAKTRPVVSRGLIDIANLTSREVDERVKELAASGEPFYTLDAEWLSREKPDLILTQDMCRACDLESGEVFKAITDFEPKPQVLVLNPKTLADVFTNIRTVAGLTGVPDRADELLGEMAGRITNVTKAVAHSSHRPKVLCLEWIDPPAAAGDWIPEMMELAGAVDDISKAGLPPAYITWERVLSYDPEMIFITPCSSNTKRTLKAIPTLARREGWWDLQAVREGHVYIIDSDYYDTPGPRLVKGIEIFAQLAHPDLVTDVIPPAAVVKLALQGLLDCIPEEAASRFSQYPAESPGVVGAVRP